MGQTLLILGAAILGILGAVHLFLTLFTNKFEAYDSSVTLAMKEASIVLTKETSIWKAWVGFNVSHSIGCIMLAGFYIPLSWSHYELIQQSIWFSYFPAVIGVFYLILAKAYWFKVPLIGILISTICFIGAAVLKNT
ncbi:hypothetical protein [Marinobacter sp. CHS3-4]|uniref:LIC_13387 family protein n=1 Tax=Marinobacter sp. CHS3-4 TaxID=3045174 RepID=UPI0024B4A460|nr:hypothetical protein [Marinobacter sp. CHS3-4]MDI9243844.1 hypothetical protein [Marinobacter sp. CHS3-4]